jgi:hypothetical protein
MWVWTCWECHEKLPADEPDLDGRMQAHLATHGIILPPPRDLPDSLDAAWAEAEAALPEGWALQVAKDRADGQAEAMAGPIEFSWPPHVVRVFGPTPAAALRALAAKLRGEG